MRHDQLYHALSDVLNGLSDGEDVGIVDIDVDDRNDDPLDDSLTVIFEDGETWAVRATRLPDTTD